jgi:hypothetical protein
MVSVKHKRKYPGSTLGSRTTSTEKYEDSGSHWPLAISFLYTLLDPAKRLEHGV